MEVVVKPVTDRIDLEQVHLCAFNHRRANTLYSVIFVHGLESDWGQTWSGSTPTTSWLQILLPNKLPNSRIITCGFDVMSSLDANLDTIQRTSDSLLHNLKKLRADATQPIIFVAHSLGGLIVENLLLQDVRGVRGPSGSSILKVTRGIIFLGTPRFKADKDWEDFGYKVNKVIRRTILASSQNPAQLGIINRGFEHLLGLSGQKLELCFFYETKAVSHDIGVMVPRASAVMPSLPFSQEKCIHADHLSMTGLDAAYQHIWEQIHIILSKSKREESFWNLKPPENIPLALKPKNIASASRCESFTGASENKTPNSTNRVRNVKIPDKSHRPVEMRKLAETYEDQGVYEDAEKFFNLAIELWKECGEPFSCEALRCQDNLSMVLKAQGKYVEAVNVCREVMDARSTDSENDRADLLLSISNMALILRDQGKSAEAFSMLRTALEKADTSLFASFKSVKSVSVFATVLKDQGYYPLSELLERDVIWASLHHEDKDDLFTLNRVSDLAVVLSHRDKFHAAEKLSRYALDQAEKTLGTRHPHALRTARRLANCLRYQGKLDDACTRLGDILRVQEKRLGAEHPDTVSTLWSFAATHFLKSQLREGDLFMRRALEYQKRSLGDEHPKTKWTLCFLNDLEQFQRSAGLERWLHGLFRKPRKGTWNQSIGLRQSVLISLLDPNVPSDSVTKSNRIRGLASQEAGEDSEAVATQDYLKSRSSFRGSDLHAASFTGDKALVDELLLRPHANANVKGGILQSSLRAAAFWGHNAVVQVLLNNSANPNAEESLYSPPLTAALVQGHKEVVSLLLTAGAAANSQDLIFGTPLQEAAYSGQTDIIKMLLRHGADSSIRGGVFGSPLRAAVQTGQLSTVKLLLKEGVRLDVERSASEGLANGKSEMSERKERGKKRLQLIENDLDDTGSEDSQSLLRLAKSEGHESVFRFLMGYLLGTSKSDESDIPIIQNVLETEAAAKLAVQISRRRLHAKDAGRTNEPKQSGNWKWPRSASSYLKTRVKHPFIH